MPSSLRARSAFAVAALLFTALAVSSNAEAARRQGDRFGLRVGAWPQGDVSGTLKLVYFNSPDQLGVDTLYEAVVEEDGHISPFLELYGLFNVRGIWWFDLSVGFAQRTNVEVAGIQRLPDPGPTDPKGDSSDHRILLGQGRVDFIPIFIGARAIKELGIESRPHNVYLRGGLSMLIASEEPSVINPHTAVRSTYRIGTKSAFGFLIGGGGEYYLGRRLGLVGDIAYRLSDLNYTDSGDYDLSGFWASAGVTLRIR